MIDGIAQSKADPSKRADETQSAGIPFAKIAIGIGALVALIAFGRFAGSYIPTFASYVEGLGFWGPIAFILAYAIAVVAFYPMSFTGG